MEETVWLEWIYTPTDFFEEPISIKETDLEFIIDQGKIEGIVKPQYFDAHNKFIEEFEKRLKSMFIGVQLVNRREYTLSRHSQMRIMADGKRNIRLSVDSGRMDSMGGIADFIYKDEDGNVITDTKRDRIDHQEFLADLINNHFTSNETVRKIIASYSAAISDPDDEFTHLYEIRDALLQAFQFDSNKLKTDLGIDPSLWNWFTNTANNPDLKQSRHRGKSSNMRSATAEELQRARDFALFLIEEYLKYIETN